MIAIPVLIIGQRSYFMIAKLAVARTHRLRRQHTTRAWPTPPPAQSRPVGPMRWNRTEKRSIPSEESG